MAQMGRKPIELNWEQLDALCAIQCTAKEISEVLKISVDTIERRVKKKFKQTFAEYFEQKRQAGFASIRRKQYEMAMAGNVTLLIWIGKQYLGQSDKNELHQSGEVSIKIDREDECL
jgi:hypothetical protein